MRSGRSRKNVPVKGKAVTKQIPGEQEFENFVSATEYEVLQDPYRGLQSNHFSLVTGTNITTPWNACVWGTLTPEETDHMDEIAIVRHVGHCACPSMKSWTKKLHENDKKRKRKKARLSSSSEVDEKFDVGGRPKGEPYRCVCDWNPLCLGSLGGVMNTILKERSRDFEETRHADMESPRKPLHENLQEQSADGFSKIAAASALDLLAVDTRDGDKDKSIFTFTDTDPNAKKSLVRLKPLRQNSRIIEGDPTGVFTMPLPSLDADKILYSPETFAELQSLRKSFTVDPSMIERYISIFLKLPNEEHAVWNAEKYIRAVDRWERTLRFVGPAMQSKEVEDILVSISVPPGIENLGATCYLNAQIQSLKMILPFLNGIFSWRAGNSTHNMNPVISKMQLLLAKMAVGGDCKLSTLDFSNALGLQHNEQQDPNEFARLLFERMEESFQQCDHKGDLKNLLRRIFQGTTTYETICMTCGESSQRSENFMDLNLPIVANGKTKGSGKSNKINDYFGGKMVDTDVQRCLNEYFCPELLNGDNQYFCNKCGSKQDAKRVLKMTTLPPLLNIQLSRYVFDLSQFVKKKLSEKVLLPITLIVPKHDGTQACYKLCAVMRHQGTSAYAGHYIAEAMDWVTGQWFEFNDEVVKHLPSGPSSSFDPQGEIEDSEVQVAPSGSKDAYNMYYVDEKFLKKSSFEELERRESRLANGLGANLQDIVSKVSQERNAKFKILYDMCYVDSLRADRLRRREIGIRKFMFPGPSSLAMVDGENFMWVEADTLRQYLRLDRSLDERIQSGGHILRHRQLLCEHEKLHPATSRKGKLIRRSTFNAYISLLKAEQSRLRQEANLVGDCHPVCDVPIALSENLICEECSNSFRNILGTKLRQLKDIRELYNCLDPSLDNRDLQYYRDGEEFDGFGHAFVYAVSKRMITKYRNAVKRLVQNFSKLNDEGMASKLTSVEYSFLEGLDCLDLSLFHCGSASNLAEISSNQKTDAPTSEVDIFFNSGIVCRHKKCNVLNDKRVVRFLPWGVWQRLKAVFPEAIELKRARVLAGEHFEDDACELCRNEKTQTESTISNLGEWAKEAAQDPRLKHLLQETDWDNFPNSSSGKFHLVHRKDLRNWRSLVKRLSNPQNLSLKRPDEIREHVLAVVAPDHRKLMLKSNHAHDDIFRTSLLPLIYLEHEKVIEDHIFQSTSSSAGNEKSKKVLAPWIVVLTDEAYRSFVTSFGKLLKMVHLSHMGEHCDRIKFESIDDEHNSNSGYLVAAGHYHPIIQSVSKDDDGNDGSHSVFSLTRNGNSKCFRVSPPLCESGLSTEKMLSFLSAEDECKVAPKGKGISDNGMKPSESNPSVGAGGTNTQEAILVESDVECIAAPPQQYEARVFALTDTGSVGEAIKCLKSRSGFPATTEENGLLGFVRRSARKKKSRYPFGCLVSETEVKVDRHLNVAALKLALFERCQVSITGKKTTLAVFWKGKHQGQLEIQSEWIERPISELVEDIQAQCEEKFSKESCDPTIELHIFHQRDTAASTGALHETVMDALLQAANFDNFGGTKKMNTKKRKRTRSTELGFQGTLLHSRPSAVTTNSGSSADEQGLEILETCVTCGNGRKLAAENLEGAPASKKPHLYSSESDDDIPEASPFAAKQTMKATSMAGHTSDVCNKGGFDDDVKVIENVRDDDHSKAEDFHARRKDDPSVHESVVTQVLSILGESVDQSTCWDAVEWAMKTHPKEKNQESLVEVVLNKVLQ